MSRMLIHEPKDQVARIYRAKMEITSAFTDRGFGSWAGWKTVGL